MTLPPDIEAFYQVGMLMAHAKTKDDNHKILKEQLLGSLAFPGTALAK